jgi:hypothetical protein
LNHAGPLTFSVQQVLQWAIPYIQKGGGHCGPPSFNVALSLWQQHRLVLVQRFAPVPIGFAQKANERMTDDER